MRRTFVGLLAMLVCGCAVALKDSVPADASLEGRWTVNTSLSDDGEALLARRMEEEMKDQRRYEERRRRRMENDPFAWEPEFTPPENTPQYRARMEERDRSVRRMFGMTKFLNIKQDLQGAKVEIVSEFETRRFDAGSRSQVSLPQGQLADQRSGWEGEWFAIERNSRDGPMISEKYRRLKKTDQLEVLVAIKGRTMFAGMKLRRVFDRAVGEPAPRSPAAGPVR
jgi:hypothetical protein